MRYVAQILLSNTMVAVLLALLALTARWLCRRPALGHALCVLVLLKLLTPPLRTIPINWPAAQPQAGAEALADPSVADAQTHSADTAGEGRGEGYASAGTNDSDSAAPNTPTPSDDLPWSDPASTPVAAEDSAATPGASVPNASPPPSGELAFRSFLPTLETSLGAIWLAGSVLCALLIAFRLRRFLALLRYAQPCDADMRAQAERAASAVGLHSCPQVLFIPGAVCPMLLALGWRKRLLIPARLWERLDRRQRETLLLHELAHLRRRDHWVRLLEVLSTIIYWWHPLLWWARHNLRKAEEQCCDAWVLWAAPHSAGDYASALLEAVDIASTAQPLPALASGMGEFHDLKRRLTMIKQGKTTRALGWLGLFGIGGLGALLLPVAPLLAQSGEPRVAPPVPAPMGISDGESREADLRQPLVAQGALQAATEMMDAERTRLLAQIKMTEKQLATAQSLVRKLTDEIQAVQARVQAVERMDYVNAVERMDYAVAKTQAVPAAASDPRLKSMEARINELLAEVKALRAPAPRPALAPTPTVLPPADPTRAVRPPAVEKMYAVSAVVPELGNLTFVVNGSSSRAAAQVITARYPNAKIVSVNEMPAPAADPYVPPAKK